MIASKVVSTKPGASRGHACDQRSSGWARPKVAKTKAAAAKVAPATSHQPTSEKSLGAPKAAVPTGTTAQVVAPGVATVQVKRGAPVKPFSGVSARMPPPQAPRFTVI